MAAGGALQLAGEALNRAVSFVIFTLLDLLDATLCLLYKLLDYVMEAEWKPCYCSSAKDMLRRGGAELILTEDGESKILSLSSTNKLHLDDISDTLYLRPSLLSDVSRTTLRELRRLNIPYGGGGGGGASATFTINSTIVEMLEGKIRRRERSAPDARWSDCDCKTCTGRNDAGSLHVHVEDGDGEGSTEEDVLFIHGFISSSLFWTETVFPQFRAPTKRRYRMFAVDLLGFGRSPKPSHSLYTLREHVEMIERSVLQPYGVRKIHIVAHSLGSILALALAVKHPAAVKSLTLIAPPYFPPPPGSSKNVAQFVLRTIAPRKVWPPMALGASVACWYEHISRTICLVMCKNHRLWEFAVRRLTRNRVSTFMMEGFFCHTHNAAWHTFHNIICGGAAKMEGYLDAVSRRLACSVTVLHGRNDEVIPVDCSLAIASRVPRAEVHVVGGKDHLTIVVGRQKSFARELEHIWSHA